MQEWQLGVVIQSFCEESRLLPFKYYTTSHATAFTKSIRRLDCDRLLCCGRKHLEYAQETEEANAWLCAARDIWCHGSLQTKRVLLICVLRIQNVIVMPWRSEGSFPVQDTLQNMIVSTRHMHIVNLALSDIFRPLRDCQGSSIMN